MKRLLIIAVLCISAVVFGGRPSWVLFYSDDTGAKSYYTLIPSSNYALVSDVYGGHSQTTLFVYWCNDWTYLEGSPIFKEDGEVTHTNWDPSTAKLPGPASKEDKLLRVLCK